ncbi:MAG: hypothetical protein FJY18_06970, partial [Bacteroidetes bacterium]|nr:hypothetical protein [Bacteroidota bacterium]
MEPELIHPQSCKTRWTSNLSIRSGKTRRPISLLAVLCCVRTRSGKYRRPISLLAVLCCVLLLARCTSPEPSETPKPSSPTETTKAVVQPPPFSADSAYRWIQL